VLQVVVDMQLKEQLFHVQHDVPDWAKFLFHLPLHFDQDSVGTFSIENPETIFLKLLEDLISDLSGYEK